MKTKKIEKVGLDKKDWLLLFLTLPVILPFAIIFLLGLLGIVLIYLIQTMVGTVKGKLFEG